MLFVVVVLGLVIIGLYYTFRSKNRPPPGYIHPPSPPGLPLIGHTNVFASPHPYRQFQQWARQYGEIYRIRIGITDWYMLNTPEAIKEVFDKQSVHTSSRTPMPVKSDALSGGLRFLLMPYGPEWRKLRAISHKLLTPQVSATFKPSQEWEARALLAEVLREGMDKGDGKGGEEGYQAVRRYTVSVIMTSTYGKRVPEWDCDDVHQIYRIMRDFSEQAGPGSYIADTLTFLGKLPVSLQWWRKPLKPRFERQANLWMKLWTSLRTQMETGQAPECFVKQVIEAEYQKQGISELQAAFLAGSLIEAGSETTSAAINTALLYLAANPDVQRIAYEEIHKVIGDSRSPTFEDEANLPYVRAIVKETNRIRPVTSFGSPHYTTAPVTYRNIHIPANSVITIQQYSLHYDERLFPEPNKFKPERYLSYPEKAGYYTNTKDPRDRDHWNFGAGRRICSGLHLAENSMFIVLSKLLWAFEVLPPLGADGEEVPVNTGDDAFMPGGNTVPKEYSARWRLRNEEVRKTIASEWEDAKRDGYVLRGVKVTEEGIEV